MEEEDILKQNKRDNNDITIVILGIWASAVFTLLYGLFQKIVPSYQKGLMPVKEVAIFFILFVLSVQSLIFYLKLIAILREFTFGRILSISLSVVLLVLIFLGIFFPLFVFIGIGMLFICWKAGQLHLYSKREKIGETTRTYFRRIFILYFFLSLITLSFGLLVDTGKLPFFPKNEPFEAYNFVIEKIDYLSSQGYTFNAAEIKDKLDLLHSELNKVKTLNQVLLGSAIFLLFLLIIYGAYKASLMHKVSLSDVYKELERFYKTQKKVPKSENKNGKSRMIFLSIFSIVRIFISSIAGLIATSAYLATASQKSHVLALLTFFVVMLTSSFGFILNDYFDIEKDKFQKPQRILPSRRLSKENALYLGLFIVTTSCLLSIHLNTLAFIINMATIILLSIYSIINNKYGIFANAITALIVSFTLLIGMSVGAFSLSIFLLAIATFFFIGGREIILDIRDIMSDKAIGKSSVSINFGIKKALNISKWLFVLSTIIIIADSIITSSLPFILFIGILSNIFLWSGFLYYFSVKDKSSEKKLEVFLILTRFSFISIIPGLLL